SVSIFGDDLRKKQNKSSLQPRGAHLPIYLMNVPSQSKEGETNADREIVQTRKLPSSTYPASCSFLGRLSLSVLGQCIPLFLCNTDHQLCAQKRTPQNHSI